MLFSTGCNLTNKYIRSTDRKYEKIGMEQKLVEMDSSSILIRKVGNGPKNLILLHGFGPLSTLQWRDVVQVLHRDFTLYIPDLPYFGESTSKYEVFDPAYVARQTYAAIKKLVPERYYVAGLSYGGLIAAKIAHHHEQEVEGLILIDALSKYMDRSRTDSLVATVGFQNPESILIPEDGKALKALFEISYHKPKKYPAWVLNGPVKQLYANQKAEKMGLMHFLDNNETAIKSRSYEYAGPVQIIWGAEDRLIPVEDAYALLEMYPNSSIEVLPEVGHVANMEAPEEVSQLIKEFAK